MRNRRLFAICLALLLLCLCAASGAETGVESPLAKWETLGLSDEEILFANEHPTILLGADPDFIPYEFFDTDGVYKGIAADYLALLSQKTGLVFTVVKGLTWSQAYEYAVERKLDVLPCISKTTQRERYFLFSDAYISFQRVIFVRKDNTTVQSLDDLYGQSVAVQKDSSHHGFLANYEQIQPSLYVNVVDALKAVSNGKEIAFIGNLATSNYLAKQNGITNLKYMPIDSQESQSLYFAVRSDWPELVGIINKGLNAIDEESKIAISDKWISVEQNADYSGLLRTVSIIGAVVGLVLLVSAFWIVRLRKEIARRKKLHSDLEKAKQEAEEANQFKSNFLARMSHEIRTPLNGIIGMSYLLKKTSLSLTQKMYVEKITQSSANMLSIINDILDFSKIEAGKIELEITSFSLDQMIQDVVSIVSHKIEEQKIGFVLIKDPQVPNWFFGDVKRLEQVLINLLNNAAKFTDVGEVALDIRLTAKENERYHLAFTVRDTGIGMTDEQIGKLFVPFTQSDVSINRRFGGTGLGLSIVKNLVELMGGNIRVFSTPGEGSSFIINLALAGDKEKEMEYREYISTGPFKNMKTLVLEKTGSNMNLIQKYLESFGIHCELTTSQRSALSMLEASNALYATPFDLFIVDYETPAEGGFAYVQSVREDPGIVKKPKILMLLPMLREDLFDELDKQGISMGIGKPVVPSILLNAILDMFNSKAVAANNEPEADTTPFEEPHCVLLAEDNKTNQLIAKSILEQVGLEVILAENGKIAVESYRRYQDKVEAILMDLHMPVMNGYEAAEEIRKISGDVPIIAITADVITGVREKCERYGIYQFVSKPYDPDHLIKTVKSVIGAEDHKPEILDAESGKRNLGMDAELYRQVINEYYGENLDTVEKLNRAIGEARYADAADIVHKVKSSSGSIGAKALYEQAVRLQRALEEKKKSEIDPLGGQFIAMLNRVLMEIKGILNLSEKPLTPAHPSDADKRSEENENGGETSGC
ncbi:MAG: transporter substrate-binding domain-containing protein [Eubacteriales bacterium]|nr:transporter substrate-binding domain-containing protein [Eubacteriales bacterium]